MRNSIDFPPLSNSFLGFKDALLNTLVSKYLISPSSATIFTSELPSNLSTPMGTGSQTPQREFSGQHPLPTGSSVNPLLLAATTASNPALNPNLSLAASFAGQGSHHGHSSHSQTPTSIKPAKIPEYFPEFKVKLGFPSWHDIANKASDYWLRRECILGCTSSCKGHICAGSRRVEWLPEQSSSKLALFTFPSHKDPIADLCSITTWDPAAFTKLALHSRRFFDDRSFEFSMPCIIGMGKMGRYIRSLSLSNDRI
jgi:hypothetical protein